MLEIRLGRAMAPDEMEPTGCGICGAGFRPAAVLAQLVTPHEHEPICEACLSHLARRAEEEPIPADWDAVRARYERALREFPEPVFPSLPALLEAESRDPYWMDLSADVVLPGEEGAGYVPGGPTPRPAPDAAGPLSDANAALSAAVDRLDRTGDEDPATAERKRRAAMAVAEAGGIVASEQQRQREEAGR